MSKLEALQTLAEKVEAGESLSGDVEFWAALNVVFPRRGALASEVAKAYHGSLDAAKALHDAVLPGWSANVWSYPEDDADVSVTKAGSGYAKDAEVKGDNPARAWLLSILKALIAEEGE